MPETHPTPGQMADKTPGQRNYEAYHCACGCWRDLEPEEQQRWETAAAAVLAMAKEPPDPTPRCPWCGNPLADHHPEGWQCRLSDGPRLPKGDLYA